jgi:hypothetical protein
VIDRARAVFCAPPPRAPASLAERLERHACELAAAHGVELAYRGRGLAYRRRRRITVPPIRGRMSYLVALHELGHVLGPNPRLRLEQEVAAWQWALAHAIVEPTPANYRSILRALESYRRRAERRRRMRTPPVFLAYLGHVRALAKPLSAPAND